jgi:outer membrane lipoprotein-sorting protein
MKKIIFLVCLILVLGGCGKAAQNQEQSQTQNQEDKGIFSSIKDAFNRSLTLRCEFTDESGQKSVNYIKNKMIRTETLQDGKQIYGLFRDNKMYLWGPDSKQGMVFNLDDMNGQGQPGVDNVQTTDDIISGLEQFKDKCRVDNVADTLFAVPSDVTFSNLNDLMKQFGN